MKKVLRFVVNHPYSIIVLGLVLFCLDIDPFGALLMIVGCVIYLAKHFGNRGNKGGGSIGSTEGAYLIYGDN